MSPGNPSPEDRERTEAAIAWWMRLQNDESVGFSTEFREWLARPENERRFQAIEDTAETLDEFKVSPSISEMHHAAHVWFESQRPSRRPSWRAAYALAATLLIAIAGGAYYLWFVEPFSYHTTVGERRSVALQDGSRILLDSSSEVHIRYTKGERAVRLTKGRARFDVAHDTARPFSVTAGAETVVAVGTAFDVELRGSKVLVTLIQGRVLIKEVPDGAKHLSQGDVPVRLSTGQQLVVSADHKPAVAPIDLAITQSWEAGHLVFRGERLADAAEQINRYTDRPISIDPSAASFRISGVFSTGDTKSFVSAATGVFPVEAVQDASGTITLRRAP